jgi:PAS domain S-box-containing protein
LTGEELLGKHPLEVIATADHAAVKAGIARTFSEGEATTEARILSSNGKETWHLCSGRRITMDGTQCLVGLAVDLSERKEVEAQLREAQARLELAVRASGVGLWDWDIVQNRAFVSPEWRAQFGFQEAEIKEPFDMWKSRLHPNDRDVAIARLESYLKNPSREYQSESRLRDNDGLYRWIFTRARLLRDEEGRPLRMLGCHIDVTRHRQTEDRLLQQREQLRALAKHLNSVREEEAGRIARELHDELGAALTGL